MTRLQRELDVLVRWEEVNEMTGMLAELGWQPLTERGTDKRLVALFTMQASKTHQRGVAGGSGRGFTHKHQIVVHIPLSIHLVHLLLFI